ncbi:MAG TPA: FtsH protease activity modulator HflK [Rhodanobacteraceae bacterium]|nr:FtsH protease activity modulator HflK [Rhodanobacteraceae bacterium]
MPWKEPGEKPREPNEPWGTGQRPGNRPGRPGNGFDLDAQLKHLRRRLGPFGSGPAGLLALIVIAVLVWIAVGSWSLIDARETGILLRFGQYQGTLSPGLHLHLPRPFAHVIKVDTGRTRTVSDQIRMLTRDDQIALVDFYVQYRVRDARKFMFAVRDAEDAMRQTTLSVVRAQVGTQTLSQLMGTDNGTVMDRIRTNLQRTLDTYGSGIVVSDVGIQNVLAPQEVRDAFEDIGNARQDARRAESEARAEADKAQADARAQAAQLRGDAGAYKTRTIARAEAEVARFDLIFNAWQAAPDVTQRRLRLQAMQDVLGVSRVVIDTTGRAVVQLPPQSGVRESAPAPASSSARSKSTASVSAQKAQGGEP